MRGRLRRRRRLPLVVPLLSLAILAVGWSVFWAVERERASAGLDAFLASEAAHGRRWTCPDRTVGGYPFSIDIACRTIGLDTALDGAPAHGSLAGIRAHVLLVKPTAVYVMLDGPMTLATADHRGDFTLGWDRFGAKVRDLLGERLRIEVVGEGFALAGPNGGGTARRVEIHAGPAAPPAARDAAAVDIALKGVSLPVLDAATGDGAPLDGDASGTITHILGNLPSLDARLLDRWTAAGGRLEVANVALVKGPLSLGAAGVLGLDAAHRVDGRLDARLGGFGPLMKRYGIPLGAAEVGSLLTSLLGQKTGAPAAAPGAVALPIVFANGAVSIGPFRTALRLAPLY